MGNTASMGKAKKTGPPNVAASNIQEDDGDDEVAHAASQSIVEVPVEESRNPLDIDYIAGVVAELVPNETFKHPGTQADINAKSTIAATSTLFYARGQGPRIAKLCAERTAQGEEEKVKQLFNISPAHIDYMIAKAEFKDFSGREFHCSPIQYAFWAQDWHMWDMMLTALDEAEAKAISQEEWDEIPKEARRHKPYIGSITKEEIMAIRAELFEQYKEVVDKGLDYTITRYDRVLDATGHYQLINPRLVEVKEEPPFDLKGLKFYLMPQTPDFIPEKGKLYIKIEDGALHYQVIALSGEPVKGRIDLANLQCPLQQLDTIDQLTHYIPAILKITSDRDHTHPQALISAFETYDYGLYNNWGDEQIVQQWCGGVGMAEREVPAVIASEICHTDLLLDVARGGFKEPRFPRMLKFNNWVAGGRGESWFPLDQNKQLGIDFGVVNYGGPAGRYAGAAGGGAGSGAARRNLAALSALCEVRTIDIAELRDKLDPANHLDLAAGLGSGMN